MKDALCPFCTMEGAIFQNGLAHVRHDKYPVNPGHLLVIPKRHVSDFFGKTIVLNPMELTMKGTYLKFYVHENRKHHTILVYEWLLEHAKKIGIHGGSAFKAIAGFGRHGVLHEEHFFELEGDLPVEVVFMLNDDEAEQFLEMIRNEGLALFYVRMPAEYGVINGEAHRLRGELDATTPPPSASSGTASVPAATAGTRALRRNDVGRGGVSAAVNVDANGGRPGNEDASA